MKLIAAVSDALNVPPETFAEYRLADARNSFDPRVVPLEQALTTLAAWEVFLSRVESSNKSSEEPR
jgi:hypothetical protein